MELRRRQKPLKGGRIRVNSAVHPKTEAAIQADMRRFRVSRSFVLATLAGYHYSIDEQEDCFALGRPALKVVRRRA